MAQPTSQPEAAVLEQVTDLALLLGQHSDFEEMVRLATTKALALFRAETVSIVMLNPQTQHTRKTIALAAEGKADRRLHLIHTTLIGWSLREKQPFLTPDIAQDTRFQNVNVRDSAYRSAMCVPMRLAGSTVGHMIVLADRSGPVYDAPDIVSLERFSAVCAPFLGNAQALMKHFSAALPDDILDSSYEPLGLIGRSRAFHSLLRAISAASRCDVRVFIEGESGTGKELVARAIHATSTRNGQRFIAIDCGAIPPNLIESELFGHVKGAFTGAMTNRRGLFEEADGGTLFLDEITNLSFDVQAKLLRALQEGEIRPVGGNQTRKIDVRIIAATSASTRSLVEQKQFREDLYYRLHVFPIQVPTLKERTEDIPLLVNHFVERFAAEQKKPIATIDAALIRFLQHRRWRGNIRELENFAERIVALAPQNTSTIDASLLPPEIAREYRTFAPSPASDALRPLEDALAELEEQKIREALERCQWNQSEAARALRISERAMRYKMARLGIVRLDKSCRP